MSALSAFRLLLVLALQTTLVSRSTGRDVATAVFDMLGVQGTVTFKHVVAANRTQITVALWGLQDRATSYHISEREVDPYNEWPQCSPRALGHIYSLSAAHHETHCSIGLLSGCAEGDLSGKHGDLPAYHINVTYADVFLPLSGAGSIVGHSVVINQRSVAPFDAQAWWVCAQIKPGRLYPNKWHSVTNAEVADEELGGTFRDESVQPLPTSSKKLWVVFVIVLSGCVGCVVVLGTWCALKSKEARSGSLNAYQYQPGPIEMRIRQGHNDDL